MCVRVCSVFTCSLLHHVAISVVAVGLPHLISSHVMLLFQCSFYVMFVCFACSLFLRSDCCCRLLLLRIVGPVVGSPLLACGPLWIGRLAFVWARWAHPKDLVSCDESGRFVCACVLPWHCVNDNLAKASPINDAFHVRVSDSHDVYLELIGASLLAAFSCVLTCCVVACADLYVFPLVLFSFRFCIGHRAVVEFVRLQESNWPRGMDGTFVMSRLSLK